MRLANLDGRLWLDGGRPVVFPKLPACLAGPDDVVALPSPHVDWEVELAVVIGAPTGHVAAEAALDVVAGLTIGDIILTGTPAGIEFVRTPTRYLRPGDVLISRIEGIGELVTRFRAGVGAEAVT